MTECECESDLEIQVDTLVYVKCPKCSARWFELFGGTVLKSKKHSRVK